VKLAQHVTGVVVSDRARCFGGRGHHRPVLGEELAQLEGPLAELARRLRRVMVADLVEQLRPEDADHGCARSCRHDHRIGSIVDQRTQAGPRHPGGLVGEAGVPCRLTAAGLSLRAGDVTSCRAQQAHCGDGHLGLEQIGKAGHEERDAHGSSLPRDAIDRTSPARS
jgi:hypothetical protein